MFYTNRRTRCAPPCEFDEIEYVTKDISSDSLNFVDLARAGDYAGFAMSLQTTAKKVTVQSLLYDINR